MTTDSTRDMDRDSLHDWRVKKSGNPNKAWLYCGDKKISPLMSLSSARDLAFIHNTTLNFACLAAHKESYQAALTTERARLLPVLEQAKHALKETKKEIPDWNMRNKAIDSINEVLGEKR